MPSAPRQAFLVSHTHWDREWYLPQSRFRVDLLEVVGRVLDTLEKDPDFRHFVLDGQCVMLEDHLEAQPFDSPRIGRLVREGRLAIGPWYVLPDEFLVSGEATVRNLIHGRRVARRFGAVQPVGYLPDTFGHIAQMPQILHQAGIDSFVFTRGLGDIAAALGWLFRWIGPDGSEVLAVNQCDGYCNAGGLGFAEVRHARTRHRVDPQRAVEKIGALFGRMAERPGSEPALLNNGCDHSPAQQELGAILSALREAFPATEFVHAGFADFLAAARDHTPDSARPCWRGELLGARDRNILSGVWSTRMYLKQQNEECQNLLQRYVEPLCAMDALRGGAPWPEGLLEATWRELLLNHSHDSICGCGTDEVHREMETRFARVRQTAHQLLARLGDRLTPTFARRAEDDRTTVLTVVNPLPLRRDEVIERLVVLAPPGADPPNLRVVDEDGREVPSRIVERRFLERFRGVDYRAENFHADQRRLLDRYLADFGDRIEGDETDRESKDCFLDIRFLARDLPGLGHRNYFLTDEPAADPEPAVEPEPVTARIDEAAGAAVLENRQVRVTLRGDGSLDLVDKASGREYRGLNALEDTADIGDEYDFCPAAEDRTVRPGPRDGSVGIEEDTGLGAHAVAVCALELPRRIEPDRRRRSGHTHVCALHVHVKLQSGSPVVEIETDIDNQAEDHRLRAVFPTGIDAEDVVSDGQFLVHRRPLDRTGGDDWRQPAPPTWPQQDYSLVHDDAGGLAIFNRGLPEFETTRNRDGVVFHLTLLRCVGWLSRDDLPTRNESNAGPTLFTPEAQCPGCRRFAYALAPFSGDPIDAGIRELSERYRTPPPVHQGTADGLRPGGAALLEKTDAAVAITAVRMACSPMGAAEEDGERLIVRLFNQTDRTAREVLKTGLPALQAVKVDIFEQALPTNPLDRHDAAVVQGGRAVSVPLAPHEIATVEITFESGES